MSSYCDNSPTEGWGFSARVSGGKYQPSSELSLTLKAMSWPLCDRLRRSDALPSIWNAGRDLLEKRRILLEHDCRSDDTRPHGSCALSTCVRRVSEPPVTSSHNLLLSGARQWEKKADDARGANQQP